MDAADLRPGVRLLSTACSTEAIVVKASCAAMVTCGGRPMVTPDEPRTISADGTDLSGDGAKVGKRYTNAAGTIELLCTKGGQGSIAVDGEVLQPQSARLLPSSD